MPAPWVDIDLDEPRKLRFQHNDIADLEVATGKGIQDLLATTQFHGARVVLSYGLRWMAPKMTPQQAGVLIQKYWIEKGKTLDELADVIEAALIAGGIMPPKKEESAEGEAQPEAVS
jgi:hypothetical protein